MITFESASVGDEVWSTTRGWGEIIGIDYDSVYPLYVKYDSAGFAGFGTYTLEGYVLKTLAIQSIFWDEVVIEAPVKPLPNLAVDAKVLVWNYGSRTKYCRHFSHFKNNNIYVFDKGTSSWTGISKSAWDHWELAE